MLLPTKDNTSNDVLKNENPMMLKILNPKMIDDVVSKFIIKTLPTTGKGGYILAVENIYSIPPPPPEEHHKMIDNLNTIVLGIQTQICNLEGLAQANAILTSSKSAVMVKLAQTTVTVNAMQVQLKTLSLTTTNPTRTHRKFYCWICGRNFSHGSKTCSGNKTGQRRKCTTRLDWAEVKMGANDG